MVYQAGILVDGKLVSAATWKSYIESLFVAEQPWTKDQAIQEILFSFRQAVATRASTNAAVLLSGGVDSTLISALLPQHTAIVVGTQSAPDIAMAKKAATYFGLDLIVKQLDRNTIAQYAKEISTLLRESEDIVKIEIGIAGYAALETAKENGFSHVFTGLGAEEIFAGYQRHLTTEHINHECWRGLADDLWRRDFTRDVPIAQHFNITALTPFLDKHVIQTAMKIPGEYKVVNGERKVILREAALAAGVPAEFALRKKLAMQYGSRVNISLTKFASSQGLKKGELIKQLVDNTKI